MHGTLLGTAEIDSLIMEAELAKRQTASTYLKALAAIGILREHQMGREKVFLNPAFVDLLRRA